MEPAKPEFLRFPGGEDDRAKAEAAGVNADRRLLAQVAGGSPEALAALHRRRGGVLYSLLLRMLVSDMEAQEVLQDTLLQIWRRAGEYDPQRSPPLAWMIMIARGLALDRLRARLRRDATLEAYHRDAASLAVEELDGVRHAKASETAAACSAALARLPEPQRRAVQLAFLRGWTHEEIARAEGEPLGTVKARIRRGLLTLRQALRGFHD